MKKFGFVLSAGVVGLVLGATTVHAQGTGSDHMLCYKVRDPLKLPTPNSLDVLADLQPEFTQKGCTLIKPVEFCVPATKANVSPAPPNPSIVGQPLQNDYVCYTMKCPDAVRPTSKKIADQFGPRRDLMVKPVTICVPAIKAPVGCPVGGTDRAACGGLCADPAQQCKWDPTTNECECTTDTPPPPCAKPDKFGACGGDCSGTPGTFCQPSVSATGAHICACLPPPPPGCSTDPTTGACGGACPTDPTKKCGLDAAGNCTCIDVTQPCDGPAGANGCGGSCPLPGQICHPDSTGNCTCASPCGSTNPLTGACGGDCAAGTTCQTTPSGCDCLPPPCGFDANGKCGGTCSTGSCALDTSGACNCQPAPPPCGPALLPGCDTGFCPSGTTCKPIAGATAPTCGCQ